MSESAQTAEGVLMLLLDALEAARRRKESMPKQEAADEADSEVEVLRDLTVLEDEGGAT